MLFELFLIGLSLDSPKTYD